MKPALSIQLPPSAVLVVAAPASHPREARMVRLHRGQVRFAEDWNLEVSAIQSIYSGGYAVEPGSPFAKEAQDCRLFGLQESTLVGVVTSGGGDLPLPIVPSSLLLCPVGSDDLHACHQIVDQGNVDNFLDAAKVYIDTI